MGYLYLIMAIFIEVIATNALKASDGFTKIGPSVIAILGYGVSLYLLSVVLKWIPVAIAYAIWSGVGIILVSVVAALMFKQLLDLPAIIGIALIASGVVVIHLFSKIAH